MTIVYCRDVDGREGIAGARFAVVQIGIPNADGSFTGKESAGTEGSGPQKSRRITVNEAEAWQSYSGAVNAVLRSSIGLNLA